LCSNLRASKAAKRGWYYKNGLACFYCGDLVSKIARHYELKPMTEKEVAIALSFNKESPSRKKTS